MADIDQVMSKHSKEYRFHGVRSETLARLIAQSDGSILLWGTDVDEHIDNLDGELEAEYVQGAGYLYVVGIRDLDMSFSEFCDEGGLVLVLEKQVAESFIFDHPSDNRQEIIKAEEWKIVGGLRPLYDEDGDIIDQQAFSLEEILSESF